MKTESLIITEGNTNPLISSFSDMLLRVLKGTKYVNATAKNYSYTTFMKQATALDSEEFEIWLTRQNPKTVELILEYNKAVDLQDLLDIVSKTHINYKTTPVPKDGNEKPKEKLIDKDIRKILNNSYVNKLPQTNRNWITSTTIANAVLNNMRNCAINTIYDFTPGPGGFGAMAESHKFNYYYNYHVEQELLRYKTYPNYPAFMDKTDKQFTKLPVMHATCTAFVDLPFPRDDKNKIIYKNTLESLYRAIPSQFNKYFLIPAEFAYELAAKFGING